MGRRGEVGDRRGSGTLLNIAIMVVLLAVAAAVTGYAGYAVARHRAQNAADLAALAAAGVEGTSAMTPGVAPLGAAAGARAGASSAVCVEARRVAVANGAELTGCTVVGSPFDFVVTVRVRVAVPVHLPGLPAGVGAEANAAPVR